MKEIEILAGRISALNVLMTFVCANLPRESALNAVLAMKSNREQLTSQVLGSGMSEESIEAMQKALDGYQATLTLASQRADDA